ncbi:MAG: hypothetical protein LQ339_001378 [Xanthoria mediterranea]|nr:MAG: hypothetical protein LQ339_001378 [Xanthoria mediterranea]
MSVAEGYEAPYEQFLLFGDSLLQHSCSQQKGFAFAPALQDAFIRRLDVINRGFSGYNTSQALEVLPNFMPSLEQAHLGFMMVFFGANDACLAGSASGQHVPLDTYKQNLRGIFQHPCVTTQKPRLILVTPPPVDEYSLEVSDAAKGILGVRRTAEHTRLYAEACKETGQDLGLIVLDLWSIFMDAAGYEPGKPLPGSKKTVKSPILGQLLSDGLHFTPQAYKVLFESTMEVIKREWPEQDPDELQFVHPTWQVAHGRYEVPDA